MAKMAITASMSAFVCQRSAVGGGAGIINCILTRAAGKGNVIRNRFRRNNLPRGVFWAFCGMPRKLPLFPQSTDLL